MSKYYFYLTDDERNLIIESLISKKNALISEGKYTDGIDDTLLKILRSKKKKLRLLHRKATVKAQPTEEKSADCAFSFLNFEIMFTLSEQTILVAIIEKQPTARCFATS